MCSFPFILQKREMIHIVWGLHGKLARLCKYNYEYTSSWLLDELSFFERKA